MFMEVHDFIRKMEALLSGEADPLATLANAASFLYTELAEVSWAGFYLLRDGALVLGPFQGRPACTRIAPGRGVCGTALVKNETLLVPDVHAFPGHIACDSASASELVVPLRMPGGAPFGVLDLDSPIRGRFTEADAHCAEQAAVLVQRRLLCGIPPAGPLFEPWEDLP